MSTSSGDDGSIMMSVSDSGSEVDEGEIMNLLSNPYESLEDDSENGEEEEDEIPDIDIPVSPIAAAADDDDKGKEEEGATPLPSSDGEDGEEEEEEEKEKASEVVPLFTTPVDQYACYAFMIYCFYFYLCTGDLFRTDAIQEDLAKLSKEQSESILDIAELAGIYETRTQKTKQIVGARLIELCQAKDNTQAVKLVEAISSAALFQKSKASEGVGKCVISGEAAAVTLSVVSKADGDAATKAGKKSVNWTVHQVPVSASWAVVLQSFYLLGHMSHLLNSEIPRHCSDSGGPMASGKDAIAYIEEHLIDMPFFQFKNADRRLVVKKNKTGAYVYGQIKKQCKPITLLAMETSLRLTIFMHGLRSILTEEQLTPYPEK